MPGPSLELHGVRVFEVPSHGHELRTGADAVDIMSDASEYGATFITIPIERLGEDFFALRTRIADEIAQKFAMYGKRVAIVGDIAQRIAASKSLAAFVAESNRGRDLWFVESLQELAKRLAENRDAGEPPNL
jgi:hypothetical protein